MAKVLVIAQVNSGALHPTTAKAVQCGTDIGADAIDVAVFAADGAQAAADAAAIAGVTRVLQVDNAANEHGLSAVLAPQIVALAGDYSHVLVANTTFGKDLMPRVAGILGITQVTDIMKAHGPYQFDRPIYAGNAVTTVEAPADQLLLGTVRCASFGAAGGGGSAAVEATTVDAELPTHTRFVELEAAKADRPDLQTASRVVSGGRGVGSGENFSVIYSFADKIGAGVGASRAAVDAGFVPNDMQVGQTGKVIAPELYFAVGISGAIQHLAGIKDAGTIVAINKDPDAPIFEVADLGLVGDLFEVLPELEGAV